jgi:uncharacterized repeat protein (TIGR03803 family)
MKRAEKFKKLRLSELLIPGLGLALQVAAQNFTTLHSFSQISYPGLSNLDGAGPSAALTSLGNTLYGTATVGGRAGNGALFSLNFDGTGFTNFHSFTKTAGSDNTNTDGANPYGELVLSGNTLYGTANSGGRLGGGTVFAVNTDGTEFRTIHHFETTGNISPLTNSDGANPMCGLIVAGNTLYGTASSGGYTARGVVFALGTDGTGYTNLHIFSTGVFVPDIGTTVNEDGISPRAGLILSSNRLYGTAMGGGTFGNGTIFALNPDARALPSCTISQDSPTDFAPTRTARIRKRV